MHTSAQRLVRTHLLLTFLLLAYALSWACWLPVAVSGGIVRPGQGIPTHFPGLLGPMLAAIIVTALTEGRVGLQDLLARMARWRVGWRWWLLAIGSPLLFYAVALASATATDGWPGVGGLDVVSGLPQAIGVLGVWALLVLVNGFGEETGWRGYALPSLQCRHGTLLATLILTVFWAL